eukprot:gb/GECH01012570.1/.p1 GENE.gb/GECH01012570.1/~~gb/GECH01012570.1/.p1  ORF type:complete len:463 (+),score=76.69 gb/GECH01012570.1/:1-1389(+)
MRRFPSHLSVLPTTKRCTRPSRIQPQLSVMDVPQQTRAYPYQKHHRREYYYRRSTDHDHPHVSQRQNYWLMAAGGIALSAGLMLMAEGDDDDDNDNDEEYYTDTSPSLRQRMIGNYENRIREMSAPEKIFEYFASKTGSDGQPRMTIEDFIASVTHYDYERGIGGAWARPHQEDQKDSGSQENAPYRKARRLFNMVDSDKDAVLSFPEYLFFVTLLSIPRHDAELAFRMFDENENGSVDRDEFQRMINAMMQSTPIGRQNRDSSVKHITRNLTSFFGEQGEKTLPRQEFVDFIKSVHDTVTELEFATWDHHHRGWLPQSRFAMLLVANADQRQLSDYVKRARKLQGSRRRVTLEQYQTLQRVLERIDDVDKAMRMYVTAGRPFTPDELHHTVTAVTGEHLDPVVTDTIFSVFDINGDGVLDENEFLRMMHLRARRGLDRKRDLGFTAFLTCYKDCIRDGWLS